MTRKEVIRYWEEFDAEIDDLYDTANDEERDALAGQRKVVEFTISALREQEAYEAMTRDLAKRTKQVRQLQEELNAIREQERVVDANKTLIKADRIRSMSDEELAEFFSRWCAAAESCEECPLQHKSCPVCSDEKVWFRWLQQPAEEDAHE